MRKWTPTPGQFCQIAIITFLAVGCSGRKVDMDTNQPASQSAGASGQSAPVDPRDARLDSLTSALSRAQSRIEELDAKVSALADKTDATRIAVDNLGGSKPPQTEKIGMADMGEEPKKASAPHHAGDSLESEKAALRTRAAESKSVEQMEGAITDFKSALKLFKSGHYADAELGFNHITEQYPEHVLAGSAQFYAGESYFMMGEYKLALNEYEKVVSSFATSPRVASAVVRMSHCYSAIGKNNEAARTLALARETYDGNPSLDWPAPQEAAATAKAAHGAALNVEPIEPAGHLKDEKDAAASVH